MQDDQLIEKGTWTWGHESVDWELYQSTTPPDSEYCTAAFCVAIMPDHKILLEQEERGWGMLGGHIELGETILQALKRECVEEGGFTPANPTLFGYRKIIASTPVAHPDPNRAYPFPISYIVYYWATSGAPLQEPTEIEVIETGTFTIAEVKTLKTLDLSAIALGLKSYEASLAS